MFLVSVLAKKCKKLNSYVSKNKIQFFSKKKSNVSNISNIFKLDFITDHLLYYPQMSAFSFHTFFVLLY